MKRVFFAAFLLVFAACAGSRERRFQASNVIAKYKAVADNNDIYFELRENNFFEFYMKLFDSVKNTRYAGTYSMKGDTLLLRFYNKEGAKLIGSKALQTEGKKEIVFFDTYPRFKSVFAFNP